MSIGIIIWQQRKYIYIHNIYIYIYIDILNRHEQTIKCHAFTEDVSIFWGLIFSFGSLTVSGAILAPLGTVSWESGILYGVRYAIYLYWKRMNMMRKDAMNWWWWWWWWWWWARVPSFLFADKALSCIFWIILSWTQFAYNKKGTPWQKRFSPMPIPPERDVRPCDICRTSGMSLIIAPWRC